MHNVYAKQESQTRARVATWHLMQNAGALFTWDEDERWDAHMRAR